MKNNSDLKRKPDKFETNLQRFLLAKEPFFIIGCVRSGTTILRDLLRAHPKMDCPEETHFYRWADPFGSPRFEGYYNGDLFRKHRKLDRVADVQYKIWEKISTNRKQLMSAYGFKFIEINAGDPAAVRLFDKTPQNVYGLLLIAADFPQSKFVHIYRNPLNVVASLLEGKVMAKHSVVAAVNYWTETMKILNEFKKLYPEKLIELSYEDVMLDPDTHLRKTTTFVGEDESLLPKSKGKTHKEKNKYKRKLDQADIDFVLQQCEPFYSLYGFQHPDQ